MPRKGLGRSNNKPLGRHSGRSAKYASPDVVMQAAIEANAPGLTTSEKAWLIKHGVRDLLLKVKSHFSVIQYGSEDINVRIRYGFWGCACVATMDTFPTKEAVKEHPASERHRAMLYQGMPRSLEGMGSIIKRFFNRIMTPSYRVALCDVPLHHVV